MIPSSSATEMAINVNSFGAFDNLIENFAELDAGLEKQSSMIIFKEALNNVILSCVREENSSEDLNLKDMLCKLQKYRLKNIYADTNTYNMIVDSISIDSMNASQIPLIIDTIFEQMEHKDTNQYPNSTTFISAITVLSRSGLVDAPEHAEKYLYKMIQYYMDGKIESPPKCSTYTLVLKAWAKSEYENAGNRVEALLYKMKNSGIAELQPDTIAFSVVLDTWSKQGRLSAANRALEILNHMAKRFDMDNKNAKPNACCYSTVVAAYASIGKADEAEKVLEQLLQRYSETNDPALQPCAIEFSAAINAWSKSDRPGAALNAEGLLKRMYNLAITTGNQLLVPDTIAFTSVLHAWAKSRDSNAPHRAEAILLKMNDLQKSGFDAVKPNAVSYSTVINCWAKSNKPFAAERAQAVLEDLIFRYETTRDVDLRPNTISFSSVINAWAKSKAKDSVNRAEALLYKMEYMYESGFEYVKPNTITYNTLLVAYASDQNRANEEINANKAFSVLNKLKALERQGDGSVKPDLATYVNMIRIIANRRGNHDNAGKANEMLHEMKIRGIKADEVSLSYAFLACARTRGPKAQRDNAFMIACSAYRDLLQTVRSPSPATFANFILACAENDKIVALDAYEKCCKCGHQNNNKVKGALKRTMPHLLNQMDTRMKSSRGIRRQ